MLDRPQALDEFFRIIREDGDLRLIISAEGR